VAARARKRKVFDALNNRTWVSDIRRGLTVRVLNEYIHLWELFSNAELQPDVEDTHIRQFSNTGQYTSKSAYEALFIGAIQFGPWESVSFSCVLLDSSTQKMLDSRPAGKKRVIASCSLPTL
jgi:hypothetical protein